MVWMRPNSRCCETLRSLLVVGATAVIQQVRRGRGHPSPWLVEPIKRKPPKLAAVALANETARIACKLMVSGADIGSQAIRSARCTQSLQAGGCPLMDSGSRRYRGSAAMTDCTGWYHILVLRGENSKSNVCIMSNRRPLP